MQTMFDKPYRHKSRTDEFNYSSSKLDDLLEEKNDLANSQSDENTVSIKKLNKNII